MFKRLTGYWKTILVFLGGGGVTAAMLTDLLHVTPAEAAGLATFIAAIAVRFGPRNKAAPIAYASPRQDEP